MKFLIIDDHPMVRDSISLLMQYNFPDDCCIGYGTFEAAKIDLDMERPDLVLLDLALPGACGIEALKIIRQLYDDMPIIMLSGSDSLYDMSFCMNNGADGYVVKTESSSMIMTAIRQVLNGEKYMPPAMQEISSDINTQLKLAERITCRQLEVLQMMCLGKCNKEICNSLGLAEGTVKVHCRDIYRTLNVNNRQQAIQKALVLGMVSR